jgi:hypothetical protein
VRLRDSFPAYDDVKLIGVVAALPGAAALRFEIQRVGINSPRAARTAKCNDVIE